MNGIQIKHPLKGWVKVDVESARKFVKCMVKHMASLGQRDKIENINKERLRGITVEELLR